MACYLRDGGVAGVGVRQDFFFGLVHASSPHHQNALRPQMDGCGQRCTLAHGAVTKILGMPVNMQFSGRKYKRNGAGCQQVGVGDFVAHGQSLRAHPRHQALVAFKKSDVLARAVAGCCDSQCLHVALANEVGQAFQWYQLGEQLPQWRVVQQRPRFDAPPLGQHPAHGQQCHPAGARAQHAQVVGPVHLMGMEVLPGAGNHAHRGVEVVGTTGQRGCIDGPGRGAGDDGKWVGLMARPAGQPNVGKGFEHSHLVGRTGTTAGQ